MGGQLFPVFNVPEISAATPVQKYNSGVFFDFESGDFKRDGRGNLIASAGVETYRQWCLKTCMTERNTCLAYSADIGTEMTDALRQETRAAVESAVERTITEALKINPHTEYVREFVFTWTDDSLYCSFIVKGKSLKEMPLGIDFKR